MTNAELLNKLMEMPQDIEAKENDLLQRHRQIQELTEQMSEYKLSFISAIYEESKEDPEKKLSSQVKRDDELRRRLKASSNYQQFLDDIDSNKKVMEVIKNKVSRLKREFVAIEVTLRCTR